MKRLIGIACSPRPKSNSTILLKKALAGANASGIETELFILHQMDFSLCIGCDKCSQTGECIFDDDLVPLFAAMEQADGIITAAPVFGMGLNALGKAFVDRSQIYWTRKFELDDEPLSPRKGGVIACAGTTFPGVFDCLTKPLKYLYKMMDISYDQELLHNPIDKPGEIKEKPEVLEQAYSLGKDFL